MKLTKKLIERAEKLHDTFMLKFYYSGFKEIKGARLFYSNKIKDPYWNHAAHIKTSEEEIYDLIIKIKEFYKSKNRTPALHVNSFTQPPNIKSILFKEGFKSFSNDSIMFYGGKDIALDSDLEVRKVQTKKEIKIFVEVFNLAYGGANPDEPYGKLPPEYSEVLLESFNNNDENIKHYIGFINNEAVAIGTLIVNYKFGLLCNLGVSPSYRKKGFGAIMSLFRVKEALNLGCKIIFLLTEEGSYNEKLFTKLGFETKSIGETFILKD